MGDYKTYEIEFTDGTIREVYANRTRIQDGVLSIWTESYGARDWNHFPLVNVKSWKSRD